MQFKKSMNAGQVRDSGRNLAQNRCNRGFKPRPYLLLWSKSRHDFRITVMASFAVHQRLAIEDEIVELIAVAGARTVINASAEAARLERWYPASGLSRDEIAEIIIWSASSAHVALELGGRGWVPPIAAASRPPTTRRN
jgi:hypothetical protein